MWREKKTIILLVLFITLLFIAFLLRSSMFMHGDFYYLVDQARDMLLAKSIVVDHKITLIGPRSGIGGIFHGPLWIYLITPFFMLFHGDPFWTLVPLFTIISMAIVIAGFFIGSRLYNHWVGLLFATLLTTSASLIHTVPYTTNAQIEPLIFLFYLYTIIVFMRGKSSYIIPACFLIGLGFQFESAFAILWIPLTIFAIVLKQKMPSVKYILFSIITFILTVSTFLLFDIRHQLLMSKTAIKLITTPTKPLQGYEQYADIGFRIHDRLSSLWASLFTPLFTTNTITQYLLIFIIFAGIFVLIKNIYQSKKMSHANKEYLFIITAPLLIFGIYILYPLPLWEHYLLPITVLSALILALSIQQIWTYNVISKMVVFFFLFMTILPTLNVIKKDYFDHTLYQPLSDGSYLNQKEVAQWVMNDAKNKEFGYFVYTTSVLTYNMDYLLWWISQKDITNMPSNQKHQITYLIMYHYNVNDNNAHQYWKKNVIRTQGEILLTKQFQSGIIVEKLSISKNEQPADPNYYQNFIFR
jgi:hypothetical protein